MRSLPVLNSVTASSKGDTIYSGVAFMVRTTDSEGIASVETPVSATYVSITDSCPSSCGLKKSGACYAMSGNVAIHERKLSAKSRKISANAQAIAAAKDEAALIRQAIKLGWQKNRKPLRLHIVGDCRTTEAVSIVVEAAEEWLASGGGPVYTYTHAWRTVARKAWGKVSVLASCETVGSARNASKRGYLPALVVPSDVGDKVAKLGNDRLFPCAKQRKEKKLTCSECKFCYNADLAHAKGYVLGLRAHGINKKKLNVTLNNGLKRDKISLISEYEMDQAAE